MKNEEITKKLQKLAQLYEQLKALRISKGDNFDLEDEDFLSHAELLEEALKNYMYQFGMSIYRNKKGKRFFKKFIHEEDEVRGFEELDNHCFELQENEPNFLQRLLEYTPENRVLLTGSIENVVEELYEKDPQMIDIFDELLNEEAERCMGAIKESRIDADIEKTFAIQNEITSPEIKIEFDAPAIEIADIEKDIATSDKPKNKKRSRKKAKTVHIEKTMHEAYQCGTDNVEEKSAAPERKIKINPEMAHDNANER